MHATRLLGGGDRKFGEEIRAAAAADAAGEVGVEAVELLENTPVLRKWYTQAFVANGVAELRARNGDLDGDFASRDTDAVLLRIAPIADATYSSDNPSRALTLQGDLVVLLDRVRVGGECPAGKGKHLGEHRFDVERAEERPGRLEQEPQPSEILGYCRSASSRNPVST